MLINPPDFKKSKKMNIIPRMFSTYYNRIPNPPPKPPYFSLAILASLVWVITNPRIK